jgi:phytol kinase
LIAFFIDNFPTPYELSTRGPLWLAYAFGCLALAGYLKRARGWQTPYTRKTFHFLTFAMAAALQWGSGTRAVCLFGAMTSLAIFYAVWRGDGHLLYEAIARERDAPHRTHFILVPYLATLVGGVVSSVLFGHAAFAGFLVTGMGDAVGEPVGARFGRHRYRVPSLRSVPSTRSIEGSAAVFAVSAIAIGVTLVGTLHTSLQSALFLQILGIALACALLEAVSPHGWDNATLQIAPSFLVYLTLS